MSAFRVCVLFIAMALGPACSFGPRSGGPNRPKHNLWMDKVDVTIESQALAPDGTAPVIVQLSANPQLLVYDNNGRLVTTPVLKGQFEVTAHLVAELPNGQRVLLNSKPGVATLKVQQGHLGGPIPLTVDHLPGEGQIDLTLKLVPQRSTFNPPTDAYAFEGVYRLGEAKKLKGSWSAQLRPEYNTSARDGWELGQYLPKETQAKENITYNIEARSVTYNGPVNGKESTTRTTVKYSLYACVHNPLDYSSTVPGKKFTIESGGQKESISRTTNSFGCMEWAEQVAFDRLEPRRLINQNITITEQGTGNVTIMPICYNPWEPANPVALESTRNPTICQTLTPSQPQYQVVDKDGKIKIQSPLGDYGSEIFISRFFYEGEPLDYSVDADLNLIIRRRYNLTLNPKIVVNGTFLDGRGGDAPLPPGYYLLRLVLAHLDEKPARLTYITHWEKPVWVQSETISTFVDFYMSDLRTMGARARLLIEVLPIDESKLVVREDHGVVESRSKIVILQNTGLRPHTLSGQFIPIENRSSGLPNSGKSDDQAELSKISASELIEQGKANRAAMLPNADGIVLGAEQNDIPVRIKRFGEVNDLAVVELNRDSGAKLAQNLGVSTQVLNDFVMTMPNPQVRRSNLYKQLSLALCDYWINRALPQAPANPGMMKNGFLARKGWKSTVLWECQEKPEKFFTFDKKIHIGRVGGNTKFTGGRAENYNIGSNFRLGELRSWDHTKTRAFTGSVFGGPTGAFAGATVGMAFSDVFGMTDTQSMGKALDFTLANYLVVTKSNFLLEINQYEQCLSVLPSVDMFLQYRAEAFPYLSDPQQAANTFGRGLHICTGAIENRPQTVPESYFFFSQHFTPSFTSDTYDMQNQPWLLALRGYQDYLAFFALTEKYTQPCGADKGREAPYRVLAKAVNQILPSTPGVYTQLSPTDVAPDVAITQAPSHFLNQITGGYMDPTDASVCRKSK